MRRQAVRAVTVMTPVAMVLVGLPFIFYVLHLFFADDAGNSFFSDFVASFPNYGLFTAISFGGLGALFSRFLVLQQSDLQVSVDDAAAYYSFRYILLRVIVGIVGAIIVYFFVGTGLVEGDLVPKITRLSFQPAVLDPNGQKGVLTLFGRLTLTAMVPTKDFALLVIWSFLAGFSERLVPNLLSTTSERIEERYKQQTPAERTTAAPDQ